MTASGHYMRYLSPFAPRKREPRKMTFYIMRYAYEIIYFIILLSFLNNQTDVFNNGAL